MDKTYLKIFAVVLMLGGISTIGASIVLGTITIVDYSTYIFGGYQTHRPFFWLGVTGVFIGICMIGSGIYCHIQSQ